jgi:IS5 family transposase
MEESNMKQRSLAESGYERRPKATKRQRFLSEMDAVVPWLRLVTVIEPTYPRLAAKGGRPPFPIETMLRIHFMQQWFALSDPGMEEALHDIPTMRAFAKLDAGDDLIPDESSILRFRHRLEQHGLAERLFDEVNALLTERGLLLRQGTIVDATLINAPSSTKNQSGERDPEMHQTKKGNNWYFGCKAHIGVDAESGLTHSVVTTAANVNDVTQAHALLHGEETAVFGDAGYQGVEKREETQDSTVTWHVAMKPGKRRALPGTLLGELLDQIEHAKASIRSKGEHPFRVVKRQFGYLKTRYRGLMKNGGQIVTLFALANLYQARHRLLAMTGEVRP